MDVREKDFHSARSLEQAACSVIICLRSQLTSKNETSRFYHRSLQRNWLRFGAGAYAENYALALAARLILRRLEQGDRVIRFPLAESAFMKLMRILPVSLFDRIAARQRPVKTQTINN